MSDERPDLRAVLEHYDVQIRGDFKAMVSCPLHDDRTPSMSVDFNKQLWNCKSCGKAGDSYKLIMEKEGTNFVGARALATTLGFATGSVGGGDGELRGNAYTGSRRVPVRKRDRRKGGSFTPSWRRP